MLFSLRGEKAPEKLDSSLPLAKGWLREKLRGTLSRSVLIGQGVTFKVKEYI